MANKPEWELSEAFVKAAHELERLEEEYHMARFLEKADAEKIKEDLIDQRRHVENLMRLRNEFEKNQVLKEQSGTEKAKVLVAAVAVVPAVVRAAKNATPVAMKLLKINPK